MTDSADNPANKRRSIATNPSRAILPLSGAGLSRAALIRALLALLCAGSILSCAERGDIVLGLAGSFSGQDYKLGVDGRNAAELFVQKANEAGGIRGRKLRLEIRDFKSDDANILSADRELAAAGAIVIIGHFTSASALAALDFAHEEKIALVSPTASAESLGGKDDFFFRSVMSSSRDPVAIAADMAARGRKSLLAISASQNRPYAETYTEVLEAAGKLAGEILFEDPRKLDWDRIARTPSDAYLLITNSLDTGTIAQELHVRGLMRPLYLSGFAATGGEEVLESGGTAVEGAWFVHQVDETQASLVPVAAEFERNFGTAPNFAAIETWDAMCLVRAAIEKGGTGRESFYRAIREIRSFKGAVGNIDLDEFGDARRPLFIRTIKEGHIVIVGLFE